MFTSSSACDVCGRSLSAKMSVFGRRPYFCSCSSPYLLEDLAIRVGRRDAPSDLRRFEVVLILLTADMAGRSENKDHGTSAPTESNGESAVGAD